MKSSVELADQWSYQNIIGSRSIPILTKHERDWLANEFSQNEKWHVRDQIRRTRVWLFALVWGLRSREVTRIGWGEPYSWYDVPTFGISIPQRISKAQLCVGLAASPLICVLVLFRISLSSRSSRSVNLTCCIATWTIYIV